MIKTLGLAGAALAATPFLAKASAFEQLPGMQKIEAAAPTLRPPTGQTNAKPLVLIVKGDQILGYRGLKEMRVVDSSLTSMLNSRFSSMGAGS